jgi:hypothetical protein
VFLAAAGSKALGDFIKADDYVRDSASIQYRPAISRRVSKL